MFHEIESLDESHLNYDLFTTEYLTKKPVKITGLADSWPAYQKWTEGFFRKNFGDLIVPVREYQELSYKKKFIKLVTYLDYWLRVDEGLSKQENLYLADWEISREKTVLLEDFTTPVFFKEDFFDGLPSELKFGRTWIFIGHPFVSTPLHQDSFATSAWLTMIQGKKTIRLIPSFCSNLIKSHSSLFDERFISLLMANNVPAYEVTIDRGDTLFIPARWFHEVINLDKNIMLTRNFLDKWNFLHFTVNFEDKFNQPLKKIIQERNKFIKLHLTNQEMFINYKQHIPASLLESIMKSLDV